MQYKFRITFKKVIKQVVIALLAIVASGLMKEYPTIAEFNIFGGFTVYAILIAFSDWLKHRWGVRI